MFQASCGPDSRGFPGPQRRRRGHSPRLEAKRAGSLLMAAEQGLPAAAAPPLRPAAARSLHLFGGTIKGSLSLREPFFSSFLSLRLPLLSAPPLAPTGAAFADSRTKGDCRWRRVRRGAEGAHLLRGVWRGGGGGGAMAQSAPLASRAPWKPFESEARSHLEPRLDLRPSRVPSSAGRSRREGPV